MSEKGGCGEDEGVIWLYLEVRVTASVHIIHEVESDGGRKARRRSEKKISERVMRYVRTFQVI
jgi:hypothetical protein